MWTLFDLPVGLRNLKLLKIILNLFRKHKFLLNDTLGLREQVSK